MTPEEIKKLLKELIEIDLQHTSSDYEKERPARVKEIEHELYIVGILDVDGAFICNDPKVDEFAAYYWNLFDVTSIDES